MACFVFPIWAMGCRATQATYLEATFFRGTGAYPNQTDNEQFR